MHHSSYIDLAIEALETQRRLEQVKRSFSQYTQEEMQEDDQKTGIVRQAILDYWIEREELIDNAIKFLKSL